MKTSNILLIFSLLSTAQLANASELWVHGTNRTSGWFDNDKTWIDDSNMCWAAASSNLIEWWQSQLAPSEIPINSPKQGEVFSTFKDNFTNGGSMGYVGLDWWFSGDYLRGVDPSFYPILKTENFSIPKTNASGGGYFKTILPEHALGQQSLNLTTGLVDQENLNGLIAITWGGVNANAFTQSIVNSINSNKAILLEINHSNFENHSLSVWGAEYANDNTTLSKLFVSDSDDNQTGIYELNLEYSGDSINVSANAWNNSYAYSGQAASITTLATEGFMPIPEPATASLGLLALGSLFLRRRRI